MSRFLGPIHHWLYSKINLLEDIEKGILTKVADPAVQASLEKELVDTYGPYLNHAPLESLIDQDNIHGWLQNKIKIAELRQSRLIEKIVSSAGEDTYKQVAGVYADFGKKHGGAISTDEAQSPEQIFKALDNFLLEGMPCDRVNAVTSNTPDKLEWQKDRCVHEPFWNEGGTNVSHYYDFREAFSKAFVEAANPKFTYTFELKNGLQYHMISKK
ncbi:hypothetical protein [Fusibacter sp. JL216-2]|uniref:hypothetical protein n=1 Tax=Fusibacter sp. JL216-2 TaxID=3071453 RepID=UPI003D327581